MSAHLRTRAAHMALAVVAVLVGLLVHGGRTGLGPLARDVVGDALWAAMIVGMVGATVPRARVGRRGAMALGICVAVELSQLLHGPTIDAVRRTTFGELVLGSGFDPRDLAAYAVGVLAATLLERLVVGRRRPRA
ncbi:MAG: DUF2809 domain-containing protein [Acidobacteriota bacterium]